MVARRGHHLGPLRVPAPFGLEIDVSPGLYGSPSVCGKAIEFGCSYGGFFSDYAATSDIDQLWGEGGLSWNVSYWGNKGGGRVSGSWGGPYGS